MKTLLGFTLLALAVGVSACSTEEEADPSAPAGVTPVGTRCTDDTTCNGGRCVAGGCVPGSRCTADTQCTNTRCVDGACLPASATDGS